MTAKSQIQLYERNKCLYLITFRYNWFVIPYTFREFHLHSFYPKQELQQV